MQTRSLFFPVLWLIVWLLVACQPQSTTVPAEIPTQVPTEVPVQQPTEIPLQRPAGIWEGAQEAGDVDWSMTLDFDACTIGPVCAKVYYVLCAGEFTYQNEENGTLVFQENITERPDQCFSGATVHVNYQGQDHPMLVSWLGEDGSLFTTAEMHYQDPAAQPEFDGLGKQVALFRNMGAVNWGLVGENGNLWIPEFNRGTLARINTQTGELLARIEVGDPSIPSYNVDPNVVLVSGDQIWVTQRAKQAVARIDPATNAVVDIIPVEVEPFNLALDGNTLWVTAYDEGMVLKVDVQSRQVLARLDIPAPSDVAVINGVLWVTEHRDGNLVLVDPKTTSVVEKIALPPGSRPCSITLLDNHVWVANRTGNSVSRIEITTKEVTTIPVPQNAAQLTAGGGFIWVALVPGPEAEVDLSKNAIAKIDPVTNTVVQVIPFTGASNVEYLDGVLWVDNRNDMSGDKLHAIRLNE